MSAAFSVAGPQRVRIQVVDARGRRLALLADRHYGTGLHDIVWDGRDEAGREAPTGVYFVYLETDNGRDAVKISLLR